MLRKLSPQARRGGLILLAAFVLLAIAALLPYVWLAEVRSEIAHQKAEHELVIARIGRASGRLEPRIMEKDRPERMFLAGATEGTALAAFQSHVADAANRSGLSILRLQPLPAADSKGLVPVRLSVDCAGSLQQLQAFLVGIEAALPLVVVTGLDVEPSTKGADVGPHPSENLAVSLRLEAYSWRAGR